LPHKKRFNGTAGMKKLIKDLKSQGFKVGLYSSAGDYTQGNGKNKQTNPGSYGYE
jgi:hypothetical protein